MSRSKRIPILKDKPRNYKRTSLYWRPIRSRINQIVRGYAKKYDNSVLDLDDDTSFDFDVNIIEQNSIMLGTDIPNSKTIVEDWDYCDWTWDFINPWCSEKDKIKYSRK